ncbi:MAG: T9SS type A sorting domain-containing protein, partial [Salinivirgaceae bacterium]|nr:T9SS type A sorting domain-containing protein [Salinivirgaceae bacterium]
NTDNWSIYASSGAAASIASVTQTGYSGKACKATITNAGTSIWNVQMRQNIPLVNGKTYSISFKASAASARTIGLLFMKGISPYTTNYLNSNISITTTPTVYGPFTYQCNVTDNNNFFAFLLGGSTSSVYIDDVSITESTTKSAVISNAKAEVIGDAISNEVIMYPNPATDVLNIQLSAKIAEKVTVNVIDLQGRVVSSIKQTTEIEGTNRIAIDVQTLKPGTYIVNVATSEYSKSKIVVINK